MGASFTSWGRAPTTLRTFTLFFSLEAAWPVAGRLRWYVTLAEHGHRGPPQARYAGSLRYVCGGEKAVTAAIRKGAYMESDSTTRHKPRGRVVMLVDNGVKGGSQVRKSRRSAADAGWDVVLFGVSPDSQKHSWKLGSAEVRLIPKPTPLNPRRHDMRRPFPAPPARLPFAAGHATASRPPRHGARTWPSGRRPVKAAKAGHPGRSAGGSTARLLVPRLTPRSTASGSRCAHEPTAGKSRRKRARTNCPGVRPQADRQVAAADDGEGLACPRPTCGIEPSW
ncbi:hypothetical protein SMICM17S_09042 [Streptomyces microflavus]